MEAQELRVGNLMRHNAEWNHKNISGIFQWDETDWYAIGESLMFLENVSGIELTPEILTEKCGFIKDETSEFGGWTIKISESESIRIINDSMVGYCWPLYGNAPVLVNYLHKLQNLFYCLTGKDIEIKKI